MGSRVYWVVPDSILGLELSGNLTVDDMRPVIWQSIDALHRGPLSFILNCTDLVTVEPEVYELSSLSQWIYHPNSRWFAYVAPPPFFMRVMKMRHRGSSQVFENTSEALHFLNRWAKSNNRP
jgi:hypothetical protein